MNQSVGREEVFNLGAMSLVLSSDYQHVGNICVDQQVGCTDDLIVGKSRFIAVDSSDSQFVDYHLVDKHDRSCLTIIRLFELGVCARREKSTTQLTSCLSDRLHYY